MKFPRLPLLSTLLRKTARVPRVRNDAFIAETIDAALRKAGLIRDSASPSPSRAAAVDEPTPRRILSDPDIIDVEFTPVAPDDAHPSPAFVHATFDREAANDVPAGGDTDHATAIEPGFFSSEIATPYGKRSFKLFVPTALPRGPRPLLLMLHGCTQDPDDFALGTRMNVLAEQHGLFVLYPMQGRSDNPSRCWNWFRSADQHRGAGEPALLAELTRDVMQQYPIDADRIYVAGLSAGAAMAGILLREFPDLFAAAGMHSGLAAGAARDVPSAFAAMQGRSSATPPPDEHRSRRPVIVFQGDKDRTVHPSNAAQILAGHRLGDELTRRGSQGRDYSVTSYARSADTPAVESWLIEGAGHAWSGGDARGSHTDANGPDASSEMLRFFLDNPKRDSE